MILNNSFSNTFQLKVLKSTKKALSEEVDSAFSILLAKIAGEVIKKLSNSLNIKEVKMKY